MSGFARNYDRDRPQPPAALAQLLLVVDLGSGTAASAYDSLRESVLHHIDAGGCEACVDLLRSQGGVMDLLKADYSDEDLGISEVERRARPELGNEPRPYG